MSQMPADEWRAERDLGLWKEAVDAGVLYRYSVDVGVAGQNYLANRVECVTEGDRTRIILDDAWVYDALTQPRTCLHVEIVCKEYQIRTMR